MIAAKHHTRSFDDLAAYLIGGRSGKEVDRVAWTEALNLPTNDAKLAAAIMRHTAVTNPRVANPGLHLTLSFDPTDTIDDATIRKIAVRYLEALALSEYQVLMIAHRDRAHQHVHFMVNRVNPITGRAWHLSHDYHVTQQWERAIEREFGLRHVPGRLSREEGVAFSDHKTLTIGERRANERTGEQSLVERARSVLPDLLEADSWPELHRRLATYGMRIEPRGKGLVITDDEREIKASRVSPGLTLVKLYQRFGTVLERTDPPISDHDLRTLVTAISTIEQFDELRSDSASAVAELALYRHEDNRLDAAARRVENAWTAFDRTLNSLYTDPNEARECFSRWSHSLGTAETTRAMLNTPELFGQLLAGQTTNERTRKSADGEVRQRIRTSADLGARAIEAEHDLWQVAVEVRTDRIAHQLKRTMRLTFRDPTAAERAFHNLAHTRDLATAAEALRETPERFGALRLGADGGTKRARASARAAAEIGEAAIILQLGAPAGSVTDSPTTVTQAAARRAAFASHAFRWQLSQLYRDPDAAVVAFRHATEVHGVSATVRQMREQPQAFGTLISGELSPLAVTEPKLPGGRIAALRTIASFGARAMRAEREHTVLRTTASKAASRVDLDRSLAELYIDADAARGALLRASAANGAVAVSNALRTRPERFGRLLAHGGAGSNGGDRAAHAADAWLRHLAELAETRDEASALSDAIQAATVSAARARDATGGRVRTLTREVAETIRRLSPEQGERLTRLLSFSQRAVMARIRSHVRDALLGRDLGEGR